MSILFPLSRVFIIILQLTIMFQPTLCDHDEPLNFASGRQKPGTRPDDWDPDGPLIFNTDEWHVKEWGGADKKGKNMMRQAFRNYFTGRNSLETRLKIYKKLPPQAPGETRDECNPYFVGVDFCGANGDCADIPVPSGTIGGNGTTTTPLPLDDYFRCECYKGWQGKFCDKDINECSLGVCQNNAYCENFMPPKRYTCTCLPYSYGTDCEKTYPPGSDGFSCHSADNSSMIDWIQPDNFVLLDYFPEGRVKHDGTAGSSSQEYGKQMKVLRKLQQDGKKLGHIENMWLRTHAKKVYVYNSLQPTLKETLRPLDYIKADNAYGWNFNWLETHKEVAGKKSMPFEHVVEMIFPEPTLIRAFVTRGGLEKRKAGCDTCKRLVTRYKVTFRSGARKWFKFIDQGKNDIVFSTLEPGESYSNIEDLKSMDLNRLRIRFPPVPFTSEAIRIHVIDWFPKELELHAVNEAAWAKNKYLSKMQSRVRSLADSKTKVIEAQNPVLRFDMLGCHL